MLNRMIAIGLTVIRQAVWICIFTVSLFHRAIHGASLFLANQMRIFFCKICLRAAYCWQKLKPKTMKLMTTIEPKTNCRPGAQPFVVDDRVEIFQPASLAEVVDAAITEIEASRLKPRWPGISIPAFEPRVMLAVLTYCYARQILSSSDVWSHLMQDAHFRRICQNKLPGPESIRRFRDENREALHECLTAALPFLGRLRVSAGSITRVSETQIRTEARRRMVMAACLDSLEMDEGGQA
jgi:hypothetical protein